MIPPLACEKRGARIDSEAGGLGQPLLGTDKRNRVLSLDREGRVQPPSVALDDGAELLEIVPEDSERIACKVLAGWLSPAGGTVLSLQKVFGVDRKTLPRWGRGLRCADPQELVGALAGRGGPGKLTPQIRWFIAARFPEE